MLNTLDGFWLVALSGFLGLLGTGAMFLYVLMRRPPRAAAASRVIAGLAILLFNHFFGIFNGVIANGLEEIVGYGITFGLTALVRTTLGFVAIGLIVSAAYTTDVASRAIDSATRPSDTAPPFQPGSFRPGP